jgi:hypothetical protein
MPSEKASQKTRGPHTHTHTRAHTQHATERRDKYEQEEEEDARCVMEAWPYNDILFVDVAVLKQSIYLVCLANRHCVPQQPSLNRPHNLRRLGQVARRFARGRLRKMM